MNRDQLKAVKVGLAQAKSDALALIQHQNAAAARHAAQATRPQGTSFLAHVGNVTPMTAPARVAHPAPAPKPVPRQRMLDEQAALRATISDDFDVESLLDTDDALSFRRPHVGSDVPRKLRRGHWALQAEIDLHGLTRDAARDALTTFLADSGKRGVRCVRVVHGKGIGSPGRMPVLKSKVRAWLVQSPSVLAFVHAPPAHGGHGAVLVLLVG